MRVVAIVEQDGSPVRAAVESAIAGRARVVAPDGRPSPYDIVVWAQNPGRALSLSAHALVVCGQNAGQALRCCRCSMVVTYGFSMRDTLTPSATLGESRVVSLQRRLVTLRGAAVEPADMTVDGLAGDIETRMAAAAVCLLLGLHEKNGENAGNISFS